MAYTASKDYTAKVGSRAGEGNPGRDAWVISSSAEDQARYPRALYLNSAGTVSGIAIDSASDTVLNWTVAAGWLEMGFRRITACPANTFGVL